ncbi:MarR family winged helix-turn-helix transcriptional regulator [Mycolicibacterium sp. BiH015]|uniref:MarR family winged helix-turn-helix transcriptional regulator n=1 Tax=Mycolicibacterium sp. BiH015 TaxID=3018808 RepID=UPI0022E69A3C|nr:MarR family winged helix-turn-helix transcriptional regulator [Mycolicibacterium sp. BiH015]MDA2893278.1 MarR family winged helix-turn-helix transcriptional regulator [Mycolicibacterium sp. BiH015]
MTGTLGKPPAARARTTGKSDRALAAAVARLTERTALWQEFMRLYRTIVDEMAEQMMRDHRLPLEWFDVLAHLAELPGKRLGQRQLRDRLLLSESGVSRMLARMEHEDLIARASSADDKRAIDITMTARGQAQLMQAIESHTRLVAELFTDRLSETDRQALGRIVRKLLA